MRRTNGDKRYTLAIVPDLPTGEISVTFGGRVFRYLAAFAAVVFLLSGYYIVGYHVKLFQARHHMSELYRLHRNLKALNGWEGYLKDIETRLTFLSRNDRALRMYSTLNAPDDAMYAAGIGGHALVVPDASNGRMADVRDFLVNLVSVQKRLALLAASQAEIRTALRSQRDIIDHTPSIVPTVATKISSGFGFRMNPVTGTRQFHDAVDFSGAVGDSVFAAAEGVVTIAEWHDVRGLYIEIQHKYGFTTQYAHLQKFMVSIGDSVSKSQCIGTIGTSGRTTGPNLHYCVLKNNRKVNPADYFILVQHY